MTAMQELIDFINRDVKKEDSPIVEMKLRGYRLKAQLLLEKEKEQIMNAYGDGAKGGANGIKGQHEFGWVSIKMKEKYYKQIYNKNKIRITETRRSIEGIGLIK